MTEQDRQGIASAATAPLASPMFNRAAWARILPFITYVFFIFAQDMLERLGYTPAELRWMYGVKIAAVMLVLALFWRQYGELISPKLSLRAAAVAIAAGLVVLVLWINLDRDWMVVGSATGFDPRGAMEESC